MLNRYKKEGGFAQLMQLIESSDPQKQDSLLAVIEKENPKWAHLVRQRRLSLDIIFSWEDPILAEVISAIPDNNIAMLLHALNPTYEERVFALIGASKYRAMKTLKEEASPTGSQLEHLKYLVIETTRNLANENIIKFQDFAPQFLLTDPLEGYEKFIQVVEDDMDVRSLLVSYVNRAGFGAIAANDGQAALETIKKQYQDKKIVAIIADLKMPRINGLEYLRRIRIDPQLKTLPFIIVTGDMDKQNILNAKQLNVSGYLLKPVNLEKVKLQLDKILM